ncbi:MAG: rhodanese-like domain-containing protein [Pseudorhodoplanes sp.]|uniref:rhodanese-like domain-containing protein n=1 Tax=Pseudorhodoplanes sp. TaxID=1934341 RepID=UPI003D09C2D5
MIQKLLQPIAMAVVLTMNSSALFAQSPGILQATLGETGKTPEINTEQMRAVLRDGSVLVLDTRSRAEFDAGHIPGARNLDAAPTAQLAAIATLTGGDKGKALVLYCNGPYCQASRRLGEQLSEAGFGNVRRYQLGIPVWRALGGPVAVELPGIARIFKADQTAVYIDARAAADFAKGSLPGAVSAPADDVVSGKLKKMALPEDDFNRRIILFGADAAQARKLADFMSKRPWHNVSYFPGSYESLAAALRSN